MIYEELTRKIIGCAMKVHSELGPGFVERIYQDALAIEMNTVQIIYKSEQTVPVSYKGSQIGLRRADFLIGDLVMVELKAVPQLNESHILQTRKYLEAFKVPVGLLLNFGSRSLMFRRVYNSEHPVNVAARKKDSNLEKP